MAKDKKDEREDMPVEGSETFIPYEDEEGQGPVPGMLEPGETRVGLTYAEEHRAEHPVPLTPVGEKHELSTTVRPEAEEPAADDAAARVALAGRNARRTMRRAVAVHHQLGEIARGQGAYPGEILGLHTSRGQEAMLGGNNPGAQEALRAGAVDFEANVIRAVPQGMASRYDPNEE